MEKSTNRCSVEISIKILFLVQGFFLAAIATTSLMAYNDHKLEDVRLKNSAFLIIGLAFLHFLASLVCFFRPLERHIYTPFVAFLFWSIWTIGFAIYQVVNVYEYEQVMTPTLLSSINLTGMLCLLVMVECMLHVMKIRRHSALKRKANELLQTEV